MSTHNELTIHWHALSFSHVYLRSCAQCLHVSSSSDKLSHIIGDPNWGPDSGTAGDVVTGLNIMVTFIGAWSGGTACMLQIDTNCGTPPTTSLPAEASKLTHYTDVLMGTVASQITSLTIVYSTVYSDADQRKYQSCGLLAFVRGIHRRSVNSPHKWPVTRKMFPFDDVIMTHK